MDDERRIEAAKGIISSLFASQRPLRALARIKRHTTLLVALCTPCSPRFKIKMARCLPQRALFLPKEIPLKGTIGVIAILAFGIFQGAYAQTATTKLCGQKVDYTLAPPSPDVSTDLNRYLGVWSGHVIGVQSGYNVEYEMCVAYVIERITADGTVYTQRINGDRSRVFANGVNYAVKPGVYPWLGKVVGNYLRIANDDGTFVQELHLTGTNLEGKHYDSRSKGGSGLTKLTRQ
jgi:hypothetical protein